MTEGQQDGEERQQFYEFSEEIRANLLRSASQEDP